MAGMAALRTGAGLVTVACPRSIQPTVAGYALELMTEELPETGEGTISRAANDRVDELLGGKDVVVLGPGLSRNPETEEFIRNLVKSCPVPLVLDADGLNAFEGRAGEINGSQAFRVLTPHPGEAARLIGVPIKQIQEDRIETARRIATETGACVVLKGSRTVVAGVSGETWINMTGNAAMAKGGSGDILSGIIAATLARRPVNPSSPGQRQMAGEPESTPARTRVDEIHESSTRDKVKEYQAQQLQLTSERAAAFLKDIAVAAAVYLHGLAGDFARDMLHENTVIATDLLEQLPECFRDCELQMDKRLLYLQK